MATRILIADDHERVRAALAQSIRSINQGWDVQEANDGQAAVQMAAAVRPDLVILDLRMPRLDGMKSGRMIKKLLPDTVMLLYTFTPLSYLQSEALAAGFQQVIEKPDIRALIATIQKALSPAANRERDLRNIRNPKVDARTGDSTTSSCRVV